MMDEQDISAEAQLALLRGNKKLRVKTVKSEISSYNDSEIDVILNSGELDCKSVIKIITSISSSREGREAVIINQIWYYE